MDVDHETAVVGKLLHLQLPWPHARAIGAAAVCCDRQFPGCGISLTPHSIEPPADRLDGEFGRAGGDPNADPALVSHHFVDTIRGNLAEGLVLEIMHLHALRIALGGTCQRL